MAFGRGKKKDPEPIESTPKEAEAMTPVAPKAEVKTLALQSEVKGAPPQIITHVDGAISFNLGTTELLKFCPNGKAYVRGEMQERNAELYQQVKAFFKGTANG